MITWVLTHDLDFSAILAATQGEKPSVVQIRATNLSPQAIGEIVIKALQQIAIDLEEGAVISIEPSGMRARVLPLKSR